MLDEHLLVEARPERRGEDQEERAVRRASEVLAEQLQREVDLFLKARRPPHPDA